MYIYVTVSQCGEVGVLEVPGWVCLQDIVNICVIAIVSFSLFFLARPHCFQHFTVKHPERSDCITSAFIKGKACYLATFHTSLMSVAYIPTLSLSFWHWLLHISRAARLRAWDFPTPHSKPLIPCFGGNIKRRGIERQLLLWSSMFNLMAWLRAFFLRCFPQLTKTHSL